jgi:6-phosphofructo-2-kinase.
MEANRPLQLLEANMRLKLSGPDYKDKDPVKSLEDFKARVKAYESAYEPLGKWEEDNDLQYIQVCWCLTQETA